MLIYFIVFCILVSIILFILGFLIEFIEKRVTNDLRMKLADVNVFDGKYMEIVV